MQQTENMLNVIIHWETGIGLCSFVWSAMVMFHCLTFMNIIYFDDDDYCASEIYSSVCVCTGNHSLLSSTIGSVLCGAWN